MPRAYLPRLVERPKPIPFKLRRGEKRSIARTIGANQLPPDVSELIEWNVTCYRATKEGSTSCTVANTRFTLRQLQAKGRSRREALELLANDRGAVDYTTLNEVQNLAKAVLANEPGAEEVLLSVAHGREAELRQHPRIVTANEPMLFFCGVLRLIFAVAAIHLKQPIASQKAWRQLRLFALAVFNSAGIEYPEFCAHPERLTKYLQTDVAIS